MTRAPPVGRLPAVMRPPCSCTMRCAIDIPSPVPPARRGEEWLEQASLVARPEAGSVVVDVAGDRRRVLTRLLAHGHEHLSGAWRVLHGILDQVVQGLLQAPLVQSHQREIVRNRGDHRDAGVCGRATARRDGAGHHVGKRALLLDATDPALPYSSRWFIRWESLAISRRSV